MSVVAALEAELRALGPAAVDSTLAATALALAAELDGDNSATSKSMCAKSMVEVLRELRGLMPPKEREDDIERARKRRVERLARQSAAGASPPS